MPHQQTFCLACKKKFPTNQIVGGQLFRTKNNRAQLRGKCPNGHNVARMISNSDIVEASKTGNGIVGDRILRAAARIKASLPPI